MSSTGITTRETTAQPLETVNANSQTDAFLQLIDRVASNPDVSPEKMRAFLDMQITVLDRRAEESFSQAMTKAQSEMTRVSADATNPQTRSKYASYPKLDRAMRPIYTGNGFALSFGTADSPLSEHVRVVCDVSHVDGHRRPYHIDIPADGKGAKGGDVMTKTHAVGAGVSYGMRYLLKMIFNVAIGEDDNDGNGPPPAIIDAKQLAELKKLAKETGSSIPKFCAYYQIDKIENLPASLYESAVTAFKKKGAEIAHKQASRSPLQPAPNGQAIEAATVKTLTSKMELAALSIGDFRKRFGLTKVEQINRKDINVVLGWIIDPQNA